MMKNPEKIDMLPMKEPQAARPNCFAWQLQQQRIADMTGRYGTAAQFLKTFNPGLQLQVAAHLERAYLGVAPQLGVVAAGYGEQTAVVLLCLQMEDLNNFAGVKEKMPVSRQKELSGILLTEYPGLKVTEVLLFFHRVKCGRYGRFYGMVDAMFITSALLAFMEERRTEMARYKTVQQREEAPRMEPSPTAITYSEYLERKKRKQQSL